MKRIDRLFWICIIGAGIFLLFFPVLSKYLELKRSEEKISTELRDIEKKIQDLQKESCLIRHDAQHLEQVMRDELKLVKPGEVVYKLIPEDVANQKAKPDAVQANSVKKPTLPAASGKLAN